MSVPGNKNQGDIVKVHYESPGSFSHPPILLAGNRIQGDILESDNVEVDNVEFYEVEVDDDEDDSQMRGSAVHPLMLLSGNLQGDIVEVTIVRCINLKNSRFSKKNHPYVLLRYDDTCHATATFIGGGNNPLFYETFVIMLTERVRAMDVEVWNSYADSQDVNVGNAKVQLDDLDVTGIPSRTWPLYNEFGRKAGDIRLNVRNFSNNDSVVSPNIIEHPRYHELNLQVLSSETDTLIDSISGKQRTDAWLQIVSSTILEVREIQNEFNDMKSGFKPSDITVRCNLNLRVIDMLKAVKVLKEGGIPSSGSMRTPIGELAIEYSKEVGFGGSGSVYKSQFPDDNEQVVEVAKAVKVLKEEGIGSSNAIKTFLRELARGKPRQFSHEDLRRFTSDFSEKIGFGGFGDVYKGQFHSAQVAVKVLAEKDVVEEIFMAEMSTMFKASHRNLVKFYGFCFDDDMKALVYEYMNNGSLDKILYENHLTLEWDKLFKISIGAAEGLSYLHEGCEERIIHHDIKPANVLLDSNLFPKITDFGLARFMNRDVSHVTWSNYRGTRGYMAPEMCMPSSNITYKCDVYSFGMLLFEVLGRRRNGQGLDWFPKQVWLKFVDGKLDEMIDECGIKEKDKENARLLSLVALWCAQFTPQERPSMSTVVKMLEKEIHVPNPPYPFS